MKRFMSGIGTFFHGVGSGFKKFFRKILGEKLYNILAGYFDDLGGVLKDNVREYGMFIALGVIMIIFAVLSGGVFLSSRNLSNLILQTGYIAVLAIGMTLVIVIRHIDLSVGFASGFIGALAAILMVQANVPVIFAILIVIVVGILIGMWHGFLVAYMGLPAFVATLAGMLLFRGALLQVTKSTGTIIIPSDGFNAISNGYIPDIAHVNGVHILSLAIGVIGVILFIFSSIKNRKTKIGYDFQVLSLPMFITKLIFISGLILLITVVLALYQGFSWTIVIVLVILAIYYFITNKTAVGRYIYAVGGNPEAAELSGISVKKITMLVFGSMGFLTALAGIMFASRLRSATVTAGTLFELDAIAAAFVGGVSATGGVGKVTGSIIGAVVMASLSSGMQLIGVDISLQYIVKGLVLIAAVIFDVRTRNSK